MNNEKPNRRAASAVSAAALFVLLGASVALFVLESCGPAPTPPTVPGTPTSSDTSPSLPKPVPIDTTTTPPPT